MPNFTTQILAYISNHFRDAHPDAFKKDVDTLAGLRRDWVEIKGDLHPEIVRGLMRYVLYLVIYIGYRLIFRYHAQLTFLATKFPSDVSPAFFQVDIPRMDHAYDRYPCHSHTTSL